MSRRSLRPPRCGRSLSAVVAALLLSGACSAPPLAGAPYHVAAVTVTLTAEGLQPGATVRIPAFGTVVFKNGLAQGGAVVRVQRTYAPSAACSTALGFGGVASESVSEEVVPQAVVALCFHDRGSFPFAFEGPNGPVRGVIEVGGQP